MAGPVRADSANYRELLREKNVLNRDPNYCRLDYYHGNYELAAQEAVSLMAREGVQRETYSRANSTEVDFNLVSAWLCDSETNIKAFYKVVYEGWQPVEKSDEAFAAEILKRSEYVHMRIHNYVSQDVYLEIQANKGKQLGQLAEKIQKLFQDNAAGLAK